MVASRYEALKAMRVAAFDERKVVEAPPKPCEECVRLRAKVAMLEAELTTLKRHASTRNASTQASTASTRRKASTASTASTGGDRPHLKAVNVDAERKRLRAARQARYRARKAEVR